MSVHRVRLPDVGEGVAEAELSEWLVGVGDAVTPDTPLAEFVTDKVTVEIMSPVAGTVSFLNGSVGDRIAVGTEIAGVELGDGAEAPSEPAPAEPAQSQAPAPRPQRPPARPSRSSAPASPVASVAAGVPHGRPVASPALRRRAVERGIDLRLVAGTGPDGRITDADLDRFAAGPAAASPATAAAATPPAPAAAVTPASRDGDADETGTPLRGIRRQIAERMSVTWSNIPHITYVEEIDATELTELREALNGRDADTRPRLTLLPFIARAIVIACADHPQMSATFDSDAGVLHPSSAIHLGVATQTERGLMVPVVRDADQLDLWDFADRVNELADAAREGTLTREQSSGSTITVTSLGAMGGIVTTPLINHPEVAIVGVNKLQVRPVWRDGAFQPRSMFNLSSSFDHRIVDGWDAASFVQRIKELLEVPALMSIEGTA